MDVSYAWMIGCKERGQVGLEGCVMYAVTVEGSETLLAEKNNMQCS
jgi:hypothetical protein